MDVCGADEYRRARIGDSRILDVVPHALHQRTPIYIGSSSMVKMSEAFLRGEQSGSGENGVA